MRLDSRVLLSLVFCVVVCGVDASSNEVGYLFPGAGRQIGALVGTVLKIVRAA